MVMLERLPLYDEFRTCAPSWRRRAPRLWTRQASSARSPREGRCLPAKTAKTVPRPRGEPVPAPRLRRGAAVPRRRHQSRRQRYHHLLLRVAVFVDCATARASQERPRRPLRQSVCGLRQRPRRHAHSAASPLRDVAAAVPLHGEHLSRRERGSYRDPSMAQLGITTSSSPSSSSSSFSFFFCYIANLF